MRKKCHHVVVAMKNLDLGRNFFELLGFREISRSDNESERSSHVLMAEALNPDEQVELVHYWDGYSCSKEARHFAHEVHDIGATCECLKAARVPFSLLSPENGTVLVAGPEKITIELSQITRRPGTVDLQKKPG